MHPDAIKLLNKINNKLEGKPLVYLSRDIERGIGLENYLQNFYLASIEDSYIVDQLSSKNDQKVFSLNKKGYKLESNSTQYLINHDATKEWVANISKNEEFYAQLFQFNQPAISILEKLGGKVLNNSTNLNRKFEDKLSQHEILRKTDIQIPRSEVKILEEESLTNFLGNTKLRIKVFSGKPLIIVQQARAHTGSGTFFIRNIGDWEELVNNYKGNLMKFSEYIDGESYTINGCITKKGIFIAGLQYQITGIRELTSGEGSTVGNDFSYANKLRHETRGKIYEITKKVGELMQKDGFRGLFGLDLVIKRSEIYVIEINARQTANIPLQTKLEILQDKVPLSLINLAEWLDVEIEFEPNTEIEMLEGSQVFLRSKDDSLVISEKVKSGVYRLQSDNAVKLAKDENVILLDEEGDKPLIWQHDAYSVEGIENGGFVLLIQKQGSIRNKFDEIARMQFKKQIMLEQNGELIVSPWVIEAMKEIRERVSTF